MGNDPLRTLGRVLNVTAGQALVEACSASRCANCPGGCNWGGFRGPRQLSVMIPADIVLQAGDGVWLSMNRAAMLRGAWWAYGWPLLGFFAGAAVGNMAAGDGLTLAMACVGLSLGWWLARRWSLRHWSAPRILSLVRLGPV